MPRAIQFDHYGDVDVLHVAEVPEPIPGGGEVVVRVVVAGTNPGEIGIRTGAMDAIYPTTFPSGEGTDFAGVVTGVGPDVTDSSSVTMSSGGATSAPRRPTTCSCPRITSS